jgi:hypothetical protein
VAYANRAMAFLKQAKYEQAEEDCSAALEVRLRLALQSQNASDPSRRGLTGVERPRLLAAAGS